MHSVQANMLADLLTDFAIELGGTHLNAEQRLQYMVEGVNALKLDYEFERQGINVLLKMRKKVIDIGSLKQVFAVLDDLNAQELKNVQFVENGKPVQIDQEVLDMWTLTGLTNTSFIRDGFYQGTVTKK